MPLLNLVDIGLDAIEKAILNYPGYIITIYLIPPLGKIMSLHITSLTFLQRMRLLPKVSLNRSSVSGEEDFRCR